MSTNQQRRMLSDHVMAPISPSTSLTDGSADTGSHNNNYKTALCHQWLTNGHCPRGSACNYAHGTAEIRPRYGEPPATLYKKELCKFWNGNGKCAHGDQCNYAHGQSELRGPLSSQSSSSTIINKSMTNAGPGPIRYQMSYPNPIVPSLVPPIPPPAGFSMQPNVFNPPLVSPFAASQTTSPYLMSNTRFPPPPIVRPPFWGQPPQQTQQQPAPPALLNSLLKPGHFKPLTGVQQSQTNVLLQQPPEQESSLNLETLQFTASPIKIQPPQALFSDNFISCASPPITMAEIAQKFESKMHISEDDFQIKEQTMFNANNDADFPSLGDAVKIDSKKEVIAEEAKQTEVKSFANIAAKTPAAFRAIKQPEPNKQKMAKQSASETELVQPKKKPLPLTNLAITRPSANITQIKPPVVKEEPIIQSMPATPFLKQMSLVTDGSDIEERKHLINDLFERDPYLNHVHKLNTEMFKTIERDPILVEGSSSTTKMEQQHAIATDSAELDPFQFDEAVEEDQVQFPSVEWQTVQARRRKSQEKPENLPYRPSPYTDEGYSDEDPRTESPGSSSIAQQSETGANHNGTGSHLDKSHIFYRTHICSFWQSWRDKKGPPCKHGEKCFYAHGQKKLRKLNPQYFKTVLCEKFNSGQECPYGDACNFAHGEKELRKAGIWGKDASARDQKKFFSVPHRYAVRKQRGTQTVHCTPSVAKHIEKVKVIPNNSGNGKDNKK